MGSDSSSRRRPLRDLDDGGGDIEEGDYVPGRDQASDPGSGTDGDEELRQLHRRLEGELGRRVSWLEVVMASGRVAMPPRLAHLSRESDRTISDSGSHNAVSSSVISSGAPAPRFPCHICSRRFHSPKAVDGHMRVHGNGRQVPVSGSWAATGKRGWTGGKPSVSVSLNSESTDNNSTAIAAVRPLEPVPMAIAMTSPPASPVVSTGTNLSGEESSSASAQPMHYEPPVENLVTVAYPSSTAVVVHQHAAPPPAAGQARPAHQPPVPLPAAQQAQLVRQPPGPPRARPARAPQPAREYSCKLCGKSYSSHQGLGGHAAGHKNRQKEAEAAAAAAAAMMGQEDGGAFLAAFRRGRRAQPPHECRKCHKVFPTGVALGGHMRMHYTGPPIVHKKNKKWGLVSEDDLRLALSTATEATPPPPAPAVDGRVRLFGIDIDPQVQAPPPPPPEDQGSGTAGGSSSSAGEQE